MNKTSWQDSLGEAWEALLDTLYMVGVSFVLTVIIGIALGVLLHASAPDGIRSVPFFARVVENALREVDSGRVEAARSMGATDKDIITKVLLPESVPGLVAGATLTAVMLIGFSAMAGAIGAGGLGDFAIKYGYQRFNTPVLFVAVVILIVLVQAIQSTGDLVVRSMAHKR